MEKETCLKTGLSVDTPGGERKSHHPSSCWKILIPVIGIIIVLIGNLPFFILKGNMSVSVREQLDGEIVAYILGAKYLFTGTEFYPEFLGGVYKTSLTPPSFGTLLLFKVFSPLWAYILNQFLVMLVGFAGMYLWGVKLTKKRVFSLVSAVIFSFLPYFTVYGLSVSGIPLVAWAFAELMSGGFLFKDSDDKKDRRWVYVLAYVSIAGYALFSSLVLCGYAVCFFAVAAVILSFALGKKLKFGVGEKVRALVGAAELILIYLIINRDLIKQILDPGSSFLSHKSEIGPSIYPFFSNFGEMFTKGAGPVPSLHIFIFFGTVFTLAIFAGFSIKGKASGEIAKHGKEMVFLFVLAGVIALFSAFLHMDKVATAISKTGGVLKSFQIDRFYWLYPFIWYTLLLLAGTVLTEIFEKVLSKKIIGIILWLLIVLPCGAYVLKESPFKENAMEFVRKQSTALTWDAFFSETEFKDIAEYIESETRMKQDEYRIGSIGIEPSVSLFSGFYTIDGYSNNYELSYKQRFRKVIAAELEKNDYNRDYFDSWGNRCYIYSSEYNGIRLMTKYEHASYKDLDLDTEALKDLGCRYLFAAGEIAEAEEKGLSLCKVFDGAGYTYVVYLYEVL